MVDISKEAVEAMAMAADCDLCCVDTAIALRAQAARIAELEEAVRELDAIAREAHSARNDALREAAHECEQVAYSGKYPQDDQSELGCLRCRDNVLAMIEGATND